MQVLSPTQQRIMDVLQDGLAHPFSEVAACINDEMSGRANVRVHVSNLRRAVQRGGLSIAMHIRQRVTYYQLVRTMASSNDGRT